MIFVGMLIVGISIWKHEAIHNTYWRYVLYKSTKALPRCNRVEVYHLNSNIDSEESDSTGFPIDPSDKYAETIDHKTIKGTAAEELAELWRSQTFAEKPGQYQAMCHYPAFGLRFYRGAFLVFETSVCFECNNFYLTALGKSKFWGIDPVTPPGGKLLERLVQTFPESATPEEKEYVEFIQELIQEYYPDGDEKN